MSIHRCPECGGRLYTNYCDICMRKVPFAGARPRRYRDPWEMSSAHREEAGHKCITFDNPQVTEKKQTFTQQKTTFAKPKQKQFKFDKQTKPKGVAVVAVVLALLSLLPSLFNLAESIHVDNPDPDYDLEAFVLDGQMPAMDSTGIYSDGEIEIIAESLGLYYDEPALSFWIDNFSDEDIDVMVEQVAVNGYMVDAGMYTQVDAAESCQEVLSLSAYQLEELGITEIAYIDLRVRIYERDGYEEIGYADLVRIETEATDVPVPLVATGWEMIQESDLTVQLLDSQMSSNDSCELALHLQSHSPYTVGVYTNLIRINGQEVDGFFWTNLLPETCALHTLYISGLSQLDISDFSDIHEIYIEYSVETRDDMAMIDTVIGSVLFNPNALPTSD